MNSNPGESREQSWVDAELEDSFDEELEMEIDDERISRELRQITHMRHKSTLDRRTYFRELLRLQAELVMLQDWVVHTGYKLLVIFEGRDAAGKGGVIKRITQRLNPRVCKTVALPAPTEPRKDTNGTSSATSRICRPPARSSCSTAPGTTAPASSG